jgi:hypothetical protein
MNRKQFFILLIVVLVVGGGGLLIHQRSNNSWENSGAALGGKLLPGLPVNDIAAITIKSGTNELHLARQDNLWRVRERGNYPANFSQISEWLIKLSDLKIAQSQDVGPSQRGRFDLLPVGPGEHTATQVEFADAKGKAVASLLLGKKHMKKPTGQQPPGMGEEGWPDGRYVMTGGATATLDVISDPLENTEAKPDQWLNKDFLTVEKPDAISVQFPEATNSWKLTRTAETNDWQLAGAKPKEKLDATKVSGVTTPFGSPSFNDVLPADTNPAAAGLTNVTEVTVETLDGFTYAAQIGQKRDENYPVTFTITANPPATNAPAPEAKPADQAKAAADFKARQKTLADKLAREQQYQHWIYLMPSYSVDSVLKNRADLLETETNSPPAVTGTNHTAAADEK